MANQATLTAARAGSSGGRPARGFLVPAAAVLGASLLLAGADVLLRKFRPDWTLTKCLPAVELVWAIAAAFLVLAAIGRVRVLLRRELAAYFTSPLVYILAFMLLGIFTWLTWSGLQAGPKFLVRGVLGSTSFLMMFLVPILTMRLLAQEKDTGAMEILVTDPVTDWDIVLGKFLAAVAALWAILLPLAVYPLLYLLLGKGQAAAAVPWYKPWTWIPMAIDVGPVFTGFLGAALIGVLFVSVGLFASSLTGNQAVSALIGFVIILMFWVFGQIQPTNAGLAALVENFTIQGRLEMFLEGRLDSRPIFLFLSTAALMLYLTVRSVESRKWR